MESILTSVKSFVGITEEDDSFDLDLILLTNSKLSILHQLGVGPEEGFAITGSEECWEDLLGGDNRLNFVKSYVCIKVKLSFDLTGLSSAVIAALKEEAKELEWRITAS